MANIQRPCRECRHFILLSNARTFCGEPIPPRCGVCRREIELGLLTIRPKFRHADNDVTSICPDFLQAKKAEVLRG